MHRPHPIRSSLALVALLGLGACAHDVLESSEPTEPSWHAELLEIASRYEGLGRVDGCARVGPLSCYMPAARARYSESDEEDTHGRKLYSLFVQDTAEYGGIPRPVPLEERGFPRFEQVIVKQAWAPEPTDLTPDEAWTREGMEQWGPTGLAPAELDGVVYRAGDPMGLYVMFRVAADTPNTDAGWVYGTVDADGVVTGAGRMDSCMSCHARMPGRTFGLPDAR